MIALCKGTPAQKQMAQEALDAGGGRC